jgi:hypothetical protein
LGVGLLAGLGWLQPDCSDAPKENVVSPSGKNKAVLTERNHGFAAETHAQFDWLLGSNTAKIDRVGGEI